MEQQGGPSREKKEKNRTFQTLENNNSLAYNF
jgi:hypothetical protein